MGIGDEGAVDAELAGAGDHVTILCMIMVRCTILHGRVRTRGFRFCIRSPFKRFGRSFSGFKGSSYRLYIYGLKETEIYIKGTEYVRLQEVLRDNMVFASKDPVAHSPATQCKGYTTPST